MLYQYSPIESNGRGHIKTKIIRKCMKNCTRNLVLNNYECPYGTNINLNVYIIIQYENTASTVHVDNKLIEISIILFEIKLCHKYIPKTHRAILLYNETYQETRNEKEMYGISAC